MHMPDISPAIVDELNAMRAGFNRLVGLHFISAGYDEVVAEIELGPQHQQPYGLVHGGVYSTMVETLASVGAALNLRAIGRHCVGLDNNTSFLRAVRGGTLRGRARALAKGKRTQVWEVAIEHEGQLVASGRVRMLAVEQGAAIAGEVVTIEG